MPVHQGVLVVLVLIGLLMLAAGVHLVRTRRLPAGAEPVPGEVVDVAVKRSSLTGSNQELYAPTVAYLDPATGTREVLPPAAHEPRPYAVGDQVLLFRHPVTGEMRLPLPQPRRQMALPFVLGLLVIGLGVADLAS